MSEKNAAAAKGGSAWVWGGGVVAAAIAVGSYLFINQNARPTSEELAGVVPEVAPVVQEALDTQANEETAEPLNNKTIEDSVSAEVVASETDRGTPAETSDDAAVPDDEDAASAAEGEATSTAPSIDEVRLAADGVAVVAGRAEPGATVEVIVDGDVVASAQADSGGAFAAIGIVEADDSARVLSLKSGEGDDAIVSSDEVIIAPVSAPDPESMTQDGKDVPETDSELAAHAETQSSAAAQQLSEERAESAPVEASDAVEESAQAETPPATQKGLDLDDGSSPLAQIEAPEAPGGAIDEPDSPEPPQIALLKSDEKGVTLLQTPQQPTARVQLDTIGYSEAGAVQLAGRAGSKASEVRIYVNNRVMAVFAVGRNGDWRGEVEGIDAGVYTLRVDAVDSQGAVTSRLETPFKREAPEVLTQAAGDVAGPATAVTVQRGDTLWAIARDRYGEGLLYVQVFEANRSSIRDPDLIYPGQIFELPAD